MIFGTVICLFAKRWPKFWTFALCAAIPLAAGGLSALLTRGSMDDFAALNQPPLAPPGWLFPIVWTILFILMGTASYLVVTAPTSPQADVGQSLWLYGMQLGVNFFWSIFFFCLSLYLFSFFWLLLLWGLILATLLLFARISKPAGLLLIPYLVWVMFAGYLNLGIYLLN